MNYSLPTMENTERKTNKVTISAKLDPAVVAAVERLAREDERTVSYMVDRLLKQSPLVQKLLKQAVTSRG
jgi:predicted transcriptional regulator